MKKNLSSKTLNIAVPVLTVTAICLIWFIFAVNVGDEILLPTPLAVLKKFFALLVDGRFYKAYFNTFFRSLLAFFVSFAIAFIFALISKFYQIPKKVIRTLIPLIRALPTIAVVLLLLLWTSSLVAPIVVTALVILPTVYTSICEALAEIDDGILEMCKVYGIDKKRQILEVYLPIILPTLITVIGSGISLNIKLMVAAEVISQTVNSLGSLMNQSKIYFESATLFALVLSSVITGLIFENAGNFIARRIRRKR